MLLNLDLYAPQTGSEAPGPGTAGDDSMLQQLRVLRSMGYLSPDGPLPDDDDSDQPASASPQSVDKSQGTQR